MTFANSEKQACFRARNVVVLTDSAENIAAKLIGMKNKAKLAKIAMLISKQVDAHGPDGPAKTRAQR